MLWAERRTEEKIPQIYNHNSFISLFHKTHLSQKSLGFKKKKAYLGIVAHTYNPSTQKAEAGGLQI
jgi:hypothetical protein